MGIANFITTLRMVGTLNKLTGLLIFLLPYFMVQSMFDIAVFGWMVAIVATIASVEELIIHICSREYQPDTNTAIMLFTKREK